MNGRVFSEKRGWARFATVPAYYTIAGRDLGREVVPLIRDQGLGLMVWSPPAGGLLSGKFSPDDKGPCDNRRSKFDFPVVNKERAFRCVDAMRPMAEQRRVSVARITLAWLLVQQPVSSVIIGARAIDQLKDNLEAAEVVLRAEELETLDRVSQLPEEYPDWMLERQKEYRAVVPERKG